MCLRFNIYFELYFFIYFYKVVGKKKYEYEDYGSGYES